MTDALAADIAEARAHAIAVLRASATADGFVASAADAHYTSLWARDAAFSAMGANVSGDPVLLDAVRASLRTLARVQAANGHIPDAYWPARDYWDWGEAGATDATALFIVALGEHLALHPDAELRHDLWPHAERAATWLSYQDANEFGLIDSVEAGDWMDSTLCRSGKVLYVNVLWCRALRMLAALAPDEATAHRYAAVRDRTVARINHIFWPEPGAEYAAVLAHHRDAGMHISEFPHPASPAAFAAAARTDRTHYLSHVQWGRFVDECDTLAHCLLVLDDVCAPSRADVVLRHLRTAAEPYPLRTYTRSFAPNDRWGMYKAVADQFQGERWRNPPGAYHNGAVWPFIGGLYVAALVRRGDLGAAREAMARLIAANRLAEDGGQWGFHEWIHADTGAPGGARDQAWSAGTFLVAEHALRTAGG